MSIDVKWLLYRYHSIKQAKETASTLLQHANARQTYDPNWWIHGKGGLPGSRTESAYFGGIDESYRLTLLNNYLGQLTEILATIDNAVKSLKHELHDLIVHRYINDDDVYAVAEKMQLFTEKGELNMRKYYRLHNIALEGMNIGCMPLNFLYTTEEIELIIGKLVVRKSVSNVSQNRVETAHKGDKIVS
jgi:hypothetical protein